MSDLLKTPFHSRHLSLNARMAPFAGWDMPIQYEGILAEHHWTRKEASLFDTCHMGEVDVQGATAEADLERLLTLRVSTLKDGQCRYGFLLNEQGGVIDDLTCYRRGPEHFFLVVNAGTRDKDLTWIKSQLSAETQLTDLSPTRAKLDVQGPKSREIMEDLCGEALPELKYFYFTEVTLFGVPMTLSRTGYTGEWGYELYMDDCHALTVWDKLVEDGRIKPSGLGARDTLRLEMGYSLYGHELSDETNPAEATGGAFINLKKDFIGKPQVESTLGNPRRRLVGLKLAGKRAAREGDIVVHKGEELGFLTSGSLAPSLDCAVALAYLDATHQEVGTELAILIRGKEYPATVVALPFYQSGTARGM